MTMKYRRLLARCRIRTIAIAILGYGLLLLFINLHKLGILVIENDQLLMHRAVEEGQGDRGWIQTRNVNITHT